MKLFTLEAELTLNTAGFNIAVNNARERMNDMSNSLTGVATEAQNTGSILESALGHAIGDFISDAASTLGEYVVDFLGDTVGMAAGLESANRRITKVFGDMSTDVNVWASNAKEQYGISEAAAKSYASRIGVLLSSDALGLTTEEIFSMSTALASLAGDMESMYGYGLDVTFEKLLSGLRGETEAIEDLGIDMRASALAASLGISESDWGKLDQRTRTLAMYEHIMKSTTNVQGYFAENQETYAAQMQLFNTNIQELQTTLGTMFLPVLTDAVTLLNSFFGAGEDGSEAMKGISSELGETYATIDTTAANALALVEALREMEEQGVDTANEQSMWNKLLEDLKGTLPDIGSLINDTTGSINGGTEALKNYVTEWQAMQREMAVASAMQSYQAEIAAQAKEVATLEFELKKLDILSANADAERMSWMQKAADYLFAGEDYNLGDVTDILDLYDRMEASVEEGDAYAKTISDRIDAIDNLEKTRQKLETDYLAATADLEAMNQMMIAVQSQIEALLIGTGAKKPAATEGPEARGVPTPVNMTVQVIVDGEEVSAVLVPKVSGAVMDKLDWKFAQIAKG